MQYIKYIIKFTYKKKFMSILISTIFIKYFFSTWFFELFSECPKVHLKHFHLIERNNYFLLRIFLSFYRILPFLINCYLFINYFNSIFITKYLSFTFQNSREFYNSYSQYIAFNSPLNISNCICIKKPFV